MYPAPLNRYKSRMLDGSSDASHLGDIAKSSFSGSGSDHTRSAIGPSCGISTGMIRGDYYNVSAIERTSKSIENFDLINGVY